MDELMSYYQCAIWKVETKFRFESGYSTDPTIPIEGSRQSQIIVTVFCVKIRRKNIPVTLEGIENIDRRVGSSVSFEDIY